MKKVFFDTWGWAAIAHKDDMHHSEILSFYRTFLLRKGIPDFSSFIV